MLVFNCAFNRHFRRPLLPQACGPTAQTAPTSTPCADPTIRASWLPETTLGRSTSSHTPAHSSGWDAAHGDVKQDIRLSIEKLCCFCFFPGSQPCLRWPQQSRDQCNLPVWWQLPGVDRWEGHERDAVEDSLSEHRNGYCPASRCCCCGCGWSKVNQTALNWTKPNWNELRC